MRLLNHVPAMQRRRLSALAKLAFNSVLQAADSHQFDYIVWVSKFGDEQKTLDILRDILTDQTPSPTQFSTSVHNAIAGLYSILFQDATPSTSLSCSWEEAMIEAYAFLKTQPHAQSVLVVYYDAPLPDIYANRETQEAYSMAAIVSLSTPNICLDIKNMSAQTIQQPQLFFNFWQNQTQEELGLWQKC
nr:beta-ketoacyl synthase chain length factor [Acinetobacter sp. MD2(2019)]